MIDNIEGLTFLKNKYDLHNSPEANAAALRSERRTGQQIPQKPVLRIQNYLDRFNMIIDRDDPEHIERGIRAVKQVALGKFITRLEDFPESYWELNDRILRERGEQTACENQTAKEKLKIVAHDIDVMIKDAGGEDKLMDFIAGL